MSCRDFGMRHYSLSPSVTGSSVLSDELYYLNPAKRHFESHRSKQLGYFSLDSFETDSKLITEALLNCRNINFFDHNITGV